MTVNDIGYPIQCQTRIECGATKEAGTFGGVFLFGINFTRTVVFVMFDEPSFGLRC